MAVDTETFRKKLLAEKELLEQELRSVGARNPSNPKDWVPRADDMDIQEADRNEAADRIESYVSNEAIGENLEVRYNYVLAALKRIEDGTYGICEVGGEEISPERLTANPAATTCVAHTDTV